MGDFAVRQTTKDRDGNIIELRDDASAWRRSSWDCIQDVERGWHSYYVPWTTGRTEIHVVDDPYVGKYLRTNQDGTTRNNLDDLPD